MPRNVCMWFVTANDGHVVLAGVSDQRVSGNVKKWGNSFDVISVDSNFTHCLYIDQTVNAK